MKQGWEIKKIDDVCTIKGRIGYRGYTKQDLVEKGEGAISLSPSNIKDDKIVFDKCTYISWFKYNESPEIMIYNGDIIYCKTASIGKIALIESWREKATIKPQYVVLKDFKCSKKCLYFYMISKGFKVQIDKIIGGTAIPTLSQANLGNLQIPLPPVSEQKEIVAILDKAFADIAKAKENAEQNLKNAEELFESYLQNIFENPQWEIKKTGDVCKVIAGQSPEGKYYNKEKKGLPFYQGKKEYGEKYIGEPTTWTTKVTKEAEKGDILMSVRAPVGPINIATQKICIGRGLASIRATKLINREFLYNFLLKHESEIIGNTGAVFNSINKSQIEAIEIPLPPMPEQHKIVKKLDSLSVETKQLESIYQQKINDLEELKKSILQKAFNGELKSAKV